MLVNMLWLGTLAACAPMTPEEARAAWLVNTLVDENRVWLSRSPRLLAAKYRVMAADPYDFMRGTVNVFYRDLERSGLQRRPTEFGRDLDAASILIVGDAHPENMGTMLPGSEPVAESLSHSLLVEFNDFDAAGFGPYLMDVRRALLAMAVLLEATDRNSEQLEEALEDEVKAYLEELETPQGTNRFSLSTIPEDDKLLHMLFEDVFSDGMEREVLTEATVLDEAGRRSFVFDERLDEAGTGLLPVSPAERAQVDRLLARYDRLPGMRVHDVARRFGVGVASMPAIRYAVVYDRGQDGPEDDAMLQLREVVDPPALFTVPARPPSLFDGNAHRAIEAPLLLWSDPLADARMAGVQDGTMTFKVQSWSSWFQSFDHEDIAELALEEKVNQGDLKNFAERMGRLLAQAHARSVTAEGEPALPAILADIAGRHEQFEDERVEDALEDLERLRADHALFVEALRTRGPLLGAGELGP